MNYILELKSNHICRRALNSALEATKYHEELSPYGLAEVIIFCVSLSLFSRNNKTLALYCINWMANYFNNSGLFCDNTVPTYEHINSRLILYFNEINKIIRSPYDFDVRVLYSCFYRHPFQDDNIMIAEPYDSEEFRKIIMRIFIKTYK